MKLTLVLFALVLLSSCAHHPDVRPSSDGMHSVIVTGESVEQANREALSQAESYCEEQDKKAYISKEKSQYTGSMDEESYHTTKKTGKVLEKAGAIIGVLGGTKDSTKTGVAIGAGGSTVSDVAGKGYTSEMKFECK